MKRMKKLIISTLSIIAVCMAINFAVITAKSENTPTTGNRTYIIRNYDGKVACFEEDSTSPFLVTEVDVTTLPPLDRHMLEGGVEVVGARAMSRALEDYKT